MVFIQLLTSFGKEDQPIISAPPNINILTGYQDIKVGITTIVCNKDTLIVSGIIPQEIEEYSAYIFGLNTEEYVAIKFFNNDLDANTLTAQLKGTTYMGTNFIIEQIDEDNYRISGTLSSSTLKEKPIVINFDETSMGGGNSTISVSGAVATINGALGRVTYNQILDLNHNKHDINTLLLGEIDGSIDDATNEKTGRLFGEAGYTIWVNSNSEIYSGGVDLLCSGKRRKIDQGAILGVHSWCCGNKGEDALEIPKNDAQHTRPKTYLIEMLGEPFGTDFYFFAINAATADSIHNMTTAEIEKYHLISE